MEKDSHIKTVEDNRKLSINSYITKNFLQQKQNLKTSNKPRISNNSEKGLR